MNTDLTQIPGIGEKMAAHMIKAGYINIDSLKTANLDEIFARAVLGGMMEDRCAFYQFRLAVAYANNTITDPEKLKWWNWKDEYDITLY